MQVVKALGDGAFGLNNNTITPQQQQQRQELEAPSFLRDNRQNPTSAATPPFPTIGDDQTTALSSVQGQSQGEVRGQGSCDREGAATMEGVGGGVLSTPSEEHSRRWRDIDSLLMSAAAAPAMKTLHRLSSENTAAAVNNATAAAGVQNSGRQVVAVGACGAACPVTSVATLSALSAEATTAAKRYPLLFAATRANEDVLMAAARLVASEEGESSGAEAEVQQAVAFLEEEVGTREDGGAAIWRLPSPGRREGMGHRNNKGEQ